MSETRDFFISYNKADRQWAEWIAWHLEDAGYTTVIQAWDFRPSGNFVLQMDEATQAERTLAVLSPDYLKALYTQPEWAAAFAQDPTGAEGRLLPVRVRACELTGLLKPIGYVDLVGCDEVAAAREALLSGIQRGRAKPSKVPSFPGVEGAEAPEAPSFPGALPPIWNVPHNRNPDFTGRGGILEDLHEVLHSGQAAALTQTLSGLGGVGKTQLATEYAYRYHVNYNLVWWVRAEEPATLAGDYTLLARALDLPEKADQDQGVVVQAVRRHLAQTAGWLLIFDNAAMKEAVYGYLPQGEGGHVVITSRASDWGGVAHSLTVRAWEREEAVAFILKRLGRSEAEGAAELAEALGDLPLALEQAVAYVQASGLSIGAYLELFRTRRRELWDEEEPPIGYPDTVATTWSLAMDRVAVEAEIGRDILTFCAFMAPDGIPRSFLAVLPEHLPGERGALFQDALMRNKGIRALSQHSLIEATPERLSVHRLVQAVTRDRLSKEEGRAWTEAAVAVVDGAWPEGTFDVTAWPTCERLMPHSSTCMQHAATFEVTSVATLGLANRMGFYLEGRAAYAEAEPLYRQALEGCEEVFGPKDPNTLRLVNNLASLLKSKGDLAAAEPLYRRVLRERDRALGPDHPDTLNSMNNLAALLQAKGDLPEAEALYGQALEEYKRVLGLKHRYTLRAMSNLATLLLSKGDLEAAEPLCQHALEGRERLLGPKHPATLNSVYALARLLHNKGDLAAAEPLYRRALEGLEQALGKEHPITRTVRGSLQQLLCDLGRPEDG